MDKLLNEIEIKIQLLLDQKDFEELDQNEKTIVLEHMTENMYRLKRNITLGARTMDEEAYTVPNSVTSNVMAHLNSKQQKGILVWLNDKVPVYYALMAAASVALLFLLFSEFTRSNPKNSDDNVQYVHSVDTVFNEITKLDTVVQYVDRPVYIHKDEKSKESDKTNPQVILASDNKVVQTQVPVPDLEKLDLSNKGTSLRQDNLSLGFETTNTIGVRRE